MAGQVSRKVLASVLTEAMLAQKNLQPHCDRLLQVLRRLQQPTSLSDSYGYAAAKIREFALDVEHINPAFADVLQDIAVMHMDVATTMKHMDLAPEIGKVYFIGIKDVAHYLTSCLEIAAVNGARLTLSADFAVMPDEQLYDALLAERLPEACPTTQTEAFSRVESAFYAVKLAQERHLPRCIESLGIRPLSGEPEDEDDPVAAATEHLSKTDISDDPATGESPQVSAKKRVDVDHLDRACTLVSLAVSHVDLAVAAISSFLDPKEVASISEYTDRAAQIDEDYFLQVTSM